MTLKNLDAKHAALASLIYGTMSGSFITMIESIGSGIYGKLCSQLLVLY